jgi:hypothetical protein
LGSAALAFAGVDAHQSSVLESLIELPLHRHDGHAQQPANPDCRDLAAPRGLVR